MFFSTVQKYIHGILAHIPWGHWAILGFISLALTGFLLIRRKHSVYGAFALGMTVFIGLFLLDTAVLLRFLGYYPHSSGHNLIGGFRDFFHGSLLRRAEILGNIAVFIPFGFFLSEFLSAKKVSSVRRRFGYVTLAGFGLSLTIECLQVLLQVGYFEVTDLVMNTAGTFVGAGVATLASLFRINH